MRHLDEAVSKATVIDFTHVKVFVHPLINGQLVTMITSNRYKSILVVPLVANCMASIVLANKIVVAGRTHVVELSIVQPMRSHEEDIVNASAVATALPVDVDTRVFPWVNLAVLVQVFYCV